MKKVFAFTLAEMIITLTVVAVIAALVIPVLINVKPDTNNILFRKAFYTFSEAVYAIVNDTSLYTDDNPAFTAAAQNNSNICQNLTNMLSITGDQNICGDSSNDFGTIPSFTLSNGIAFFLPNASTISSEDEKITIKVDVNGPNNGPNVLADQNNNCDGDRYEFYLYGNGKVGTDYTQSNHYCATEALKKGSKISKD